jgi:hypothetical protein
MSEHKEANDEFTMLKSDREKLLISLETISMSIMQVYTDLLLYKDEYETSQSQEMSDEIYEQFYTNHPLYIYVSQMIEEMTSPRWKSIGNLKFCRSNFTQQEVLEYHHIISKLAKIRTAHEAIMGQCGIESISESSEQNVLPYQIGDNYWIMEDFHSVLRRLENLMEHQEE